jgi:hypothetical protein
LKRHSLTQASRAAAASRNSDLKSSSQPAQTCPVTSTTNHSIDSTLIASYKGKPLFSLQQHCWSFNLSFREKNSSPESKIMQRSQQALDTFKAGRSVSRGSGGGLTDHMQMYAQPVVINGVRSRQSNKSKLRQRAAHSRPAESKPAVTKITA